MNDPTSPDTPVSIWRKNPVMWLVIGLPLLFAALQMNAPSGQPVWVAGLVTLVSGVVVSVLFSRRRRQAAIDAVQRHGLARTEKPCLFAFPGGARADPGPFPVEV